MTDPFITEHMNTQDIRAAGKGFLYRDPQTGEIHEMAGDKPLSWEEGYPPGIEPGTPESQNYDAHRARFAALPNYALSREYLDQQNAKKENSQYKDPMWIAASRILYDHIQGRGSKPAPSMGNPEDDWMDSDIMQPNQRKPLDSGYDYADWGVNFMLKFNYNLPYMVYQAGQVEKMPPDVAKALYYLMETSDRDGISAYNTGMGIAHAAWDATNLIGLATFGIGVAGSQAGKQLTKMGLKEILKAIIFNAPTKAGAATGVEGAVFAAADDLARQDVKIAGDDNTTERDYTNTAIAAGIGAVAGEELTRMGGPAVDIAGTAINKGVQKLRDGAQGSKDSRRIEGELDAEEGALQSVEDTTPEMDLDQSVGSGALKENVPQHEIDELGFYSPLLSAAKLLPPKISTADAIAILKKQSGVKEEELKWVGIDTFVELQKAEGKKSFDRQDLINHIRENQVKLDEVKRDGPDQADPFSEDMLYGRTNVASVSWNDITNSRFMTDFEREAEEFFSEGRFDPDIDTERFVQFVKFKFMQDNNVVDTPAGQQSTPDALATRLVNKLNEYEEKGVPMQEIAYGGTFDGEVLDSELQTYLQAYAMDVVKDGYESEPYFIIGTIDPDVIRNQGYLDLEPEGYYAIGNNEFGYTVQLGDYRDDTIDAEMRAALGDRGVRDEVAVQQYINTLNEDQGYLDTNYQNAQATIFGEYTLDGVGDENYKEFTLTFANPEQIKARQPSSNQGIYQGSHFNDGEVVHFRGTDRTLFIPRDVLTGDQKLGNYYDPSGEYIGPTGMDNQVVTLAIDEIQSDWAQRAQYGKGLASEENLTKWAASNDEAVKGIRTALSSGIVDEMFVAYQLGDDVRRELTEGLDFMFDQAEADTGSKAYFIKSIPAALSEIYGLKPTLDAKKLSTELVNNFDRVMDTVLVDQTNRFNPDGRRTKLDLLLAEDTGAVGIGTFQSIYDGFVESRPGMPRLSADEYASLPDTGMVANFLRFEGKQLDAIDPTAFSRNKAEEAILYWREHGKLPEGFEFGTAADGERISTPDMDKIMATLEGQYSGLMDNAVTLDEKEFMGKMVKLHENIAAQEEGFEPPSWSVDSPSDKYSIAKQMAEIFMLDLYSRLRMQLKNSAPKETYAIANAKPVMPDSPFVKGGKDFTALALKRILTQAVDGGYDAISLPSHELLTTIPGIGLQSDKLYNTIIPKEINKLIEGTGAEIMQVPAARVFKNDFDDVGNQRGEGSNVPDWDERANPKELYFNVIYITPELRKRIKTGMALFSAMPLALMGGNYMGEERGENVNTTY